ncbi:NADPH-dependent FMN reductase [Winogradskyella psychrotolerans]|uniref:NADPH-dependent FMN reductase n=1 Tax=Winogradskyella psychrotolerans TaxID=1344585 RepID=UPI001C06E301|nr:NAD(P)H-dependent oxidoreductase [Winogradskyella psychrotolerans]MBU2929834.1 NAD(P)H-dependent oxidoreductase [Winogradskyella psychrotolerans]
MKNIIAFAGSNSSTSINKQLVTYASHLVEDASVTVLDLNDFEMPIYSADRDINTGFPKEAIDFVAHIKNADGIIISLAEHNGAYSSAFKNVFDWASRVEPKTFFNKPILLMATSPGARGGQSVLQMALDRFPRHDGNIVGQFSLPSFGDNFSEGKITNAELQDQLLIALEEFTKHL